MGIGCSVTHTVQRMLSAYPRILAQRVAMGVVMNFGDNGAGVHSAMKNVRIGFGCMCVYLEFGLEAESQR